MHCIIHTVYMQCLRYGKTGNKKRATRPAILLQNKFNSDVARFTTHVQTCFTRFERDLMQDRFGVAGKTRNIAIHFALQQCYSGQRK